MKDKLLLEMNKKDKCYKIMEKLFDILEKNSINIRSNNNDLLMIKDKEIGIIKKMKDKVVINIDNINITFKGGDTLDFEFFELLIKKYI
jgi:phage antirepressor YoqD-like protein